MRTYAPKPGDVERAWLVIDATDVVLGRLAVTAANLLREREAQQIITQISSRSQAQTGLVKALGGTRRRIVTILPSIDIR